MNIEEKYFDRMVIMDEDYKKLGIDKVSEMVKEGEKLIKKHGDENLAFKLKTEKEMADAGAFMCYKLATDETSYE